MFERTLALAVVVTLLLAWPRHGPPPDGEASPPNDPPGAPGSVDPKRDPAPDDPAGGQEARGAHGARRGLLPFHDAPPP